MASLTVAAAACLAEPNPHYFEQASSFAESGAVIPGSIVYVGVGVVEVHEGDHVRFLAIDAGPDVRRELIVPLRLTDGAIGIMRDHEVSLDDLAA